MGSFKANLNSAHLIMFSLLVLLLPATTYAWCTTAGGVGDHSTHCSDAVDFEACFATCQCYDANDNPTHMHDAICSSMSASVYSTLAPMDALRAPPSAAQRAPGTLSPATTTATLTPTLAAPENFGMSTNNVPGTLNWK